MKALVTGASGFLGGALTRLLVERGSNVRALIRATSPTSHLDGLQLECVIGDLSDREVVASAVQGVSTVYHCAALSTDWAARSAFEEPNVAGVRNLLDATLAVGSVERFVHVSTTDIYGYPKQACDESEKPTDIGLPYNSTKIAGEGFVQAAHRRADLPVTIIRPATIFGPRSPSFAIEMGGLLLKGGMPLIGKGKTQAGLIYVDDVAEAMINAARSPATIGRIYNLRDPDPMTWYEYISALANGLGVSVPRFSIPPRAALVAGKGSETIYRALRVKSRPLLTRHAVLILSRPQDYSVARAMHDFEFQPSVGLKDGLQNTVQWLRSEEGRAALAPYRA